ncbi:MAG: 3-oxoacyl-[acyl-carrier-protein] reductase [Aristaeellaceae bacterium]
MSLEGRVALVTGGSRGIGRAVCLALARGGAAVALCYAGNEVAARETEEACRALGAETLALRCDVTDEAAVRDMTAAVVKRFGRVDILVNNAGITRDGLMMTMPENAFDAVIAANLKGAFLCMKAVCRTMLRQRYGRIINVSSVVGLHGNAGQANYAASKAGLIGLTKSAARELASRGVTVNAIAPGYIDTDMTAALPEEVRERTLAAIPAGRMGQAEEVAAAAAFLAGEEAAYITGQVLAVDGGMGM